MKIEVCITNLWNGNYIYGYISSINDIVVLEEEVNPFGINDTEVQLIDSDINISDENLTEFLKMKEEFNMDPVELAALFQVETAQQVREIIEYGDSYQFIEACNKETAFEEYYEELYNDVPEHLKEYIDWNKLMRNHEHGGLTIQGLGRGKHLLTDRFIFINKY